MSNSSLRAVLTSTLVLGLATVVAHPGFAQHRPGSTGPSHSSPSSMDRDTSVGRSQDRDNRTTPNTNSNGVTATDRATGDRAQDRMSQPGLSNSNGVGAPDRDTGIDRARDRMSQPGRDNNNAGDTRTKFAQGRIEADGYKNVQGLSKGSDGLWHGRAMRGSTEVPVTVDARGNVSAK